MATFKHISSKNADYGAAEQYLTFEHDEFTMKPTLDKNGRLIPRDDYRISSLNCGGEDFAIACMRSNLHYGKNQKREDVKSHHYIISFDPRDAADNSLTVERAQELGEWFCKEHFPGHQALVCTHPDGHNHSGNIHSFGRDRHPKECDCQRKRRETLEANHREQKHREEVERLKRKGFTDPAMKSWTFGNDNGKCPQMAKAHAYVEQWEQIKDGNHVVFYILAQEHGFFYRNNSDKPY